MKKLKKGLRIAAAGSVFAAGAAVWQNWENMPECVRQLTEGQRDVGACWPDLDWGSQEAAEGYVGNFDLVGEDETGTAEFKVFGEITIRLSGGSAALDYDDGAILDFADPFAQALGRETEWDATEFFNKHGDEPDDDGELPTLSLIYNPCIETDDDYSSESDEVADQPSATMDIFVDVEESGPEAGSIRQVSIEAGVLDTCFMRIAEMAENELLWTQDESNQTSIPALEHATFEMVINRLAIAYARASACPENEVDMEAIKEDIRQMALGELIAREPHRAELYSNAYQAGLFVVIISPPSVRQEAYTADYQAERDAAEAIDQTLADENGHTRELHLDLEDDFEVVECEVGVPVRVGAEESDE